MAAFTSPALTAFVAELGDALNFAQVRITRTAQGFELRHVDDFALRVSDLKAVAVPELRLLARTTAEGVFRPNKAAPNLRTGWLAIAKDAAELEEALRHLYPGALPDWFAALGPNPPVTNYRDFAGRQTGLYRVTQALSDALAAQTIRACCDQRFCLRRRLWTVAGLDPDSRDCKSLIPCLEPCALLLDLARHAMKLREKPPVESGLSESDVAVLLPAAPPGEE